MPPVPRRFRRIVIAVLLCLVASSAWSASRTFPGTVGTGAIPDNDTNGLAIPFAVAGLDRNVRSVQLRLQLTHSWAGDVSAVLTSPDGRARMAVFSHLGAHGLGTGDSSNFDGDYRFADRATGDLWAAAGAVGAEAVIAPGSYRATSAGVATVHAVPPGCPTSLDGVFGDLTPAQANGTWTLTVRDRVDGDTGTVGLAELTIDDADPALFADGFEAAQGAAKGNTPASHCINKVMADFTGDGLTDYVLARPMGADILWIVRENLNMGLAAAESEALVFTHGHPETDLIDSLDYDGDRIADATVWNMDTGTFHVRRSSRSIEPVVSIAFGQTGDDVHQSGDYDGDGRDDLAVLRAPAAGQPPGPIQLLIRASATGAIRAIDVGQGVEGDAIAAGGFDMTGDGIADVNVQTGLGEAPQVAEFRLFDGRTGNLVAQFELGNRNDYIVSGNHIGDARFDTTVRRADAGLRYHRTRDSLTNFVTPGEVQFGICGDTSLGGDYDGDGLTDFAVWRPDAAPGQSRFLVRLSNNPNITWTVVGGIGAVPPDFPVAGSRVH